VVVRERRKVPSAAQLPCRAHDTDLTSASPLFRGARPGTAIARPQVLCRSSATNPSIEMEGVAGPLGPDGKIYVFGGYPGCCGSYLSSSFSYDPASDTWTPIAPMPTPRESAAAAVAANGKIYVAGGNGSGPVEQTMETYDPAANTWETDAPMPTGMTNMSLVAAPNGNLYGFGEPEPFTSPAGTVLQYTPATNSWATLAPMPGS
jgi:N-acetylneuraminic acid mutarotase